MGGGWTCLSPCTEHLGAEASPFVFSREDPGVGKAATDPAPALCHLSSLGSAWQTEGQTKNDKNAINRKIFSGWGNYKDHQKQSRCYQLVLYRETCTCLLRFTPKLDHAALVILLPQIFTEYLLCTKHLCSVTCDIPIKQISMLFSSAQCSIYNIFLDEKSSLDHKRTHTHCKNIRKYKMLAIALWVIG